MLLSLLQYLNIMGFTPKKRTKMFTAALLMMSQSGNQWKPVTISSNQIAWQDIEAGICGSKIILSAGTNCRRNAF